MSKVYIIRLTRNIYDKFRFVLPIILFMMSNELSGLSKFYCKWSDVPPQLDGGLQCHEWDVPAHERCVPLERWPASDQSSAAAATKVQ